MTKAVGRGPGRIPSSSGWSLQALRAEPRRRTRAGRRSRGCRSWHPRRAGRRCWCRPGRRHPRAPRPPRPTRATPACRSRNPPRGFPAASAPRDYRRRLAARLPAGAACPRRRPPGVVVRACGPRRDAERVARGTAARAAAGRHRRWCCDWVRPAADASQRRTAAVRRGPRQTAWRAMPGRLRPRPTGVCRGRPVGAWPGRRWPRWRASLRLLPHPRPAAGPRPASP